MRRLLLLLLGTLLISVQLLAQNRTISGRITDAQGNAVVNASVTVKGANIGTATGNNGQFSLSVPATARTLVVSSVGFESQEITIGSKTNFDISVTSLDQAMTEVVVTVPYGTVKKKAFTGSESTITSKSIEKQQVTSVTRALEGLAPGIIATNGGGAPGSNAGIVIRGFSSINGVSSPLYVLNGVPYDGSIAALSTDEIESVTLLKDAAAASLYGSRAAGGVIMITTKTGKKGRPAVSATMRQGYLTRGIPEYDRVGPKDYYEVMWEATRNAFQYGQGQSAAQAGINASRQLTDASHLVYNAYNVPGNKLVDSITGKLNPNAQLLWNESWEDALFRTAARTNANVNISGANDKSNYFLSAGYLNEQGIEKHTGYKRYNMRLNLNTDATNWLTTGLNLDGAYSENNGVLQSGLFTSNPFYYSRNMGPIYPVYQHDLTTGAIVNDSLGSPKLDYGVPLQMGARPYATNSNLVGTLALDERSNKLFNGNSNAYAEVKFLRMFSFKTSLGLNIAESNGTTYQNSQFGDAQNVAGRLTKSFTRSISYTANEVLTWNKTFGSHNIRALAGHENYKYKTNNQSATKTGFQFPNIIELNTATVTEGTPSSSTDNLRIESYFANANYDYKGRFQFSLSGRRDGSSRFADTVRWGNFYSVGAGWVLSQEQFLKNVGWLNFLKLRASYGEVGQDDINLFYPYRDYYYGDGFGSYSGTNTIANASLHWEKNRKFNVGVDFTILKNRLQGTVEYFKNVSSDLLFTVPLYTSTGSLNVNQNIGASENRGIEVQLGYNAIRKKNFDWRIDLNVTHLKNEVTKLPPTQTEKGIVSGTKKISNGHSIYDFWLKEFAGVDAANGEALYYKDILDVNGKATGQRVITNNINQASFYYFGSAIPKFNGGLTNSFRYMNFDLSVLLTFAYGGQFYDGNYAGLMSASGYGAALHTDILNRWQKPGDVTNVPKVQNAVINQEGASSRFLFDGSYLNIKNVTLSYTLSKSLASHLHVAGVQIFTNVDNAYLFSAKKGMDPQRSFTGTADQSYPPFRTFTVGLNLNL
jgi:TonB-linked SusC/RagA family outer membrane protein